MQLYRSHVSTGGTVTVARSPTGRGQLQLQDGIRVAIFTGTTLIRALDVDPTKTYQPLGRTKKIKD